MKKALVVLSGGQDSTTCLAWAFRQGFEVSAITFDYGQRHSREIQAARDIAKLAGLDDHEIVSLGPILKGTSPLTDPGQPLERYDNYAQMDAVIGDRVEKTFVPMRNALFLTIAANRAVCIGATKIITGVCQQDNANYPDCREQFIRRQQQAINEALGYINEKSGHAPEYISILTPLMHLSKAESIKTMEHLGYLTWLAWSHTAYDGQYPPTGTDHASMLRAEGFLQAGIPDPLVVRACFDGLMQLPATANYANLGAVDRMVTLIEKARMVVGLS